MDTNPFTQVVGYWEDVVDDMEVTAAEYREAGWDIVELHPGDVTVRTDDVVGFDVLIPDDEFDRLEALVADATLDDTEVFRADQGGFVFVLAVVRDTDNERGVCCPLYYDRQSVSDLHEHVERTGSLDTYVRTLSNDRGVTITHDDPAPFVSEQSGIDEE